MATTFALFPIKTGAISAEEIDLICELAELGLKAHSIARRLERHPSSIAWHMWRLGLKPIGAKKKPFKRGNRLVVSFSEDEDRIMLELRVKGYKAIEIANFLTVVFKHPRSRDTVASRLMMLASHDACCEAA